IGRPDLGWLFQVENIDFVVMAAEGQVPAGSAKRHRRAAFRKLPLPELAPVGRGPPHGPQGPFNCEATLRGNEALALLSKSDLVGKLAVSFFRPAFFPFVTVQVPKMNSAVGASGGQGSAVWGEGQAMEIELGAQVLRGFRLEVPQTDGRTPVAR